VGADDIDVTQLMGGGDAPIAQVRPTRRRIGRYRLSYEIATGGQATVYVGVAEGPTSARVSTDRET